MSAYAISIRHHADGTYGFAVTDGRGRKVAGGRGSVSFARAECRAFATADRLVAVDRALGRRSHIETSPQSARCVARREVAP